MELTIKLVSIFQGITKQYNLLSAVVSLKYTFLRLLLLLLLTSIIPFIANTPAVLTNSNEVFISLPLTVREATSSRKSST